MKAGIIISIVIVALVLIANLQPKGDQFAGYTQLVSRVFSDKGSKRAHDLDLSKYRPRFQEPR